MPTTKVTITAGSIQIETENIFKKINIDGLH